MAEATAYPVRLERIEAGSLAENPLNWRRQLRHVVSAWGHLPLAIQCGILAMIRATTAG